MKTSIAVLSFLVITIALFAGADASQPSSADGLAVSPNGRIIDPSSATVIDDSAIRPLTSSDSGTLTIATVAWSGCFSTINIVFGFSSPRGIGSYSPAALTGGKTVVALYDTKGDCVGTFSDISISGFSSNPGSSWLSSLTCNGVENNGSAATFIYSSGTASWEWSQLFGLQSKENSSVSCTVVHN